MDDIDVSAQMIEMEHLSGNHHEHMAALDLVRQEDATHQAISNGDWFDPATWSNGEVPGEGSRVFIGNEFSVTYSGQSDASIFTIGVAGTLRFDPNTDSKLIVDTMVVSPSGRLEIGTAANPVGADVNIDIVIANNGEIDTNWDAQLLSRGIVSMGEAEIFGAEIDAHVKVTTDPMSGDTVLILAEAAEGWQVGDTIVVAGTINKGHYGTGGSNREYEGNSNEERVITSIDGNQITLNAALEFDHPSPREELKTSVANYSRSITIRSEDGADSAVHERGHVMFMASDDVDVRYAAFEHLGRTDKSERSTPVDELDNVSFDSNVQGRYSLHLHQLGLEDQDNPIIIEGNAVIGSPGWGIAQHSSNANLHNNATLDIFGASYIAEAGNETGTWSDNISIGNEGVFGIERDHTDVAHHDLGRTGNGFWLQSRMIETIDNIAASARTGFVWVAQGSTAEADPLHTEHPDAVGLAGSVNSVDLAISLSAGNEVFGSERGLTVTKGDPNQGHDIRSMFEGFTAWEVRSGVNVEYTSHYTFNDFVLIGASTHSAYAPVRDGFHAGNNASDLVFNNAEIDGFQNAYSLTSVFTPSLNATEDQKQFFVVGGDVSNMRDGMFRQDDWADRTTIVDPADIVEQTPQIDVGITLIGEDGRYPDVRFFGTKTDSLGEIPIPAGTDEYRLTPEDVVHILETDGYYKIDGKKIFIADAYYQDRLTGEIVKIGHPVMEAVDDTVIGWGSLKGAVYKGEFPTDNIAPVATDDVAETNAGEGVVVNVLSNDSDPNHDAIRVDGIIQPRHGKVYDLGDGSLKYVPDISFSGEDTFEYFVTDGFGQFTKASVVVDVKASNDDSGDPDPVDPDPIDPDPEDPTPTEGGHESELLFSTDEAEFDGTTASVIILEHDDTYSVEAGTLAMRFTADNLSGRQGLFSKDSSGYDDGGHIGVFLEGDNVRIRIQDTSSQSDFMIENVVSANTDHHLAITFGETGLDVYLDGIHIGGDPSWTGGLVGNEEPIVIGANQWASGNKVADKIQDVFDGKIENVSLYHVAMTSQEIEVLAVIENDDSAPVDPDPADPENPVDPTPVAPEDADPNEPGIAPLEATFGTDGGNNLSGTSTGDWINGGAGGDKIQGYDGDDTLIGGDDGDYIVGGNGNDAMFGDAGNDNMHGHSGNDVINGGSGDDALLGHGGNDQLFGDAGNDNLLGHSGDDQLSGGQGDDVLTGGGGIDLLRGGSGNDVLMGQTSNDMLEGGSGDDALDGGRQHDSLNGGLGNDLLTGGEGNDTFIFEGEFGHDVITDFLVGLDAHNLIEMHDRDAYDTFAEVLAAATDNGTDTYIAFDDSNSITLNNVTVSDLSHDHFWFF